MIIVPDSADVTTYFKLIDPATGVPETGLVIANLDATYVRDRAAAVQADLVALPLVTSPHDDNHAIEVDAINAPGLYRVDWPDAAFLAGVARVQLVINGAAIDPAVIEVELTPNILDEVCNGTNHFAVNTLGEFVTIVRGLSQSNWVMDSTTYDGNGFLTAGRIRIFPDRATALAATDGGVAEGEIATFTIAGVAEAVPATGIQIGRVTRNP